MSDRTRKGFHGLNILLLLCGMLCLVYYDVRGGLWLKGVTSSWFFLLGMVNILYAHRSGLKEMRFPGLTAAGLFFGMCADVLLGIEFFLGVLFFALGHILYLIAFYSLEKPRWQDLWFILPVMAVSLFFVMGTPFIRIEDPGMETLLVGYGIIISCMLGKAVSNAFAKKQVYRKLILLGAVLFWFSDLMLAIDMFGTSSRLTWILCSYTYWPAQNILAYALFRYAVAETGGKQ